MLYMHDHHYIFVVWIVCIKGMRKDGVRICEWRGTWQKGTTLPLCKRCLSLCYKLIIHWNTITSTDNYYMWQELMFDVLLNYITYREFGISAIMTIGFYFYESLIWHFLQKTFSKRWLRKISNSSTRLFLEFWNWDKKKE